MSEFYDARLDSPAAISAESLTKLALLGARIRRDARTEPIGRIDGLARPRGVIALGREARLLRAVLEPVCPAPLIAWPAEGLPGWVGPLDLVILLGGAGEDPALLHSAQEAVRRGASIIVAAPTESALAVAAASNSSVLLPTNSQDTTSTAVITLALLHEIGLGPAVKADDVADAADKVAEACSPLLDASVNPGKRLAMAMADDLPLIWGGTVLAARASRRVAEAIRAITGRPALAIDADDLYPLLGRVGRRDLFSDPFDEGQTDRFPMLMVMEDRMSPAVVQHAQIDLSSFAEGLGLRVHTVSAGEGGDPAGELDRYVTLLQLGLYGATYLGIGLGADG